MTETPREVPPVDVDAILAEVRERIRRKQAAGIYSTEVAAALTAPLPGGAPLLVDELASPLAALATYLGGEARYDPTSRRPIVGPLVTFARRTLIWLLRWWIHEVTARQERINRLVVRKFEELDQASPRSLEARVVRLEEEVLGRRMREGAEVIDSHAFAERFGGEEEVVKEQAERFVPIFEGRARVLDLGSGRGTFLELMRERGIGAYGVDLEPKMVRACVARGLEVYQIDAYDHLRQLPKASLDGIFSAHFAEHLDPERLVEVLREACRVLKPNAPIVMATPNVGTLTVGAHTFWLDPSHRRPLPPELFHWFLEIAGFIEIRTESYARGDVRLSEDVPEGAARDNVKRLNDVIFGDRDYAVIGLKPPWG